jgi:hypothetical protein
MAEEIKPALSEEEIIAKKVKMRRMISYILMAIGGISLIVFMIYAYLTKGNIDTQTAMNTQELRSKLKNIISLETRYYKENNKYVPIEFLQNSKELTQYDPQIDGKFKFKFDVQTLTATGMEKDAAHDVNGDNDGNDGLTLTIKWETGVVKGSGGSNLFWTEEDLKDFDKRAGRTSTN